VGDIANLATGGPTEEEMHRLGVKETPREQVEGKLYKAQNAPERILESGGEAIPTAPIGPGGPIAKGVSARGGGLGAGIGDELARGTVFEPYARTMGSFIGGNAPQATRQVIAPMRIKPGREDLVRRKASAENLERKYGVKGTAG